MTGCLLAALFSIASLSCLGTEWSVTAVDAAQGDNVTHVMFPTSGAHFAPVHARARKKASVAAERRAKARGSLLQPPGNGLEPAAFEEHLQKMFELGRDVKVYIPDLNGPVPDVLRPARQQSEVTYNVSTFLERYTAHDVVAASLAYPFMQTAAGSAGSSKVLHMIAHQHLLDTQENMLYYLLRERLRSSSLLAGRIQDARVVLYHGELCDEKPFQQFVIEEQRLLTARLLKRPLLRLSVCACDTNRWFALYEKNTRPCLRPLPVQAIKHLPVIHLSFIKPFDFEHALVVPYMTHVHGHGHENGDAGHRGPAEQHRRLLLSFAGSVNSTPAVTKSRLQYVTNLAEAEEASAPALLKENADLGLIHLFYAPLVDGLPNSMGGSWRGSKQKGGMRGMNVVLYTMYGNSHFCLNIPGDDGLRRAIFDAFAVGCIPVIYNNFQADAVYRLFDGLAFPSQEALNDLFWFVHPNVNSVEGVTNALKGMMAAVRSGEVERRRAIIRATYMAWQYALSDENDAFVLTLAAVRKRMQARNLWD